MDLLLRAITADASLRVVAAVTTDLGVEACRRHELRGVEAVVLGRALTAGCLLTTLTKSSGERLRVDLRTDGLLGGLLLDARGDGTVRGCLRRTLGSHPLRTLIEGRRGVFEIFTGDSIPGVGRVDAIRKQDGRWVVVTSKGLIVSR